MNRQELTESLRILKQWINDPANAKNHVERKAILTKMTLIKAELRAIQREENVEEFNKRNVDDPNVIIKTVIVEEDFTQKNIDTYRYHALLKRLNDKYIKDNCGFKPGDLVKSGDKEGFIDSFEVYPNKVKRKITGIYAKLLQKRLDGSKSQKTLRKSRLDEMGFPIEELVLIPK